MFFRLGFATLLLATLASAQDDNIVLKPLASTAALDTKVLIFIPGGLVPNNNYTETAQAIQQYTDLNLWVVIPSVFKRRCIIQCSTSFTCGPLKKSLDGAVADAVAAGMPADTEQHLAGHSLGGTCANYLVQAYPTAFTSLTLMGSYIDETGNSSLAPYPVPVAMIGAELDGGMARPGKFALWVKQFQDITAHKDEDDVLREKPVVIINQIDHSNFCPGFAVPGDLPSELDTAAASKLIGQVAGAYLNLRTHTASSPVAQDSLHILQKVWADTQVLTAPILAALAQETDTGMGMFYPGTVAPWCEVAQLELSGVSAAARAAIVVQSVYKEKDGDFEHTRATFELQGSTLFLNVSGHGHYSGDLQNTGGFIAAEEIGCKLVNSDRVAQQLNITGDGTAQCKDINEKALEMALDLASPATLQRYKAKGRGVCFANDTTVAGNVGPLFIITRLKLTESVECLTVQSIKLQTPLDGNILPGVHYCKLLSPARILDWIMTDSLKPGK